MDKAGGWEQKMVIHELIHGRECAKQLQIHLNPSSPAEVRKLLGQKILSSFTKALSMLKWADSEGELMPAGPSAGTESPGSVSGSPRSENSDRGFKDEVLRDISKKRKTMPKWAEQVRVSPGAGLEGPLDDGYSWRKYGQKDILGAKHPRGYYRCTHRHVQGCLATKQVQRSDQDPDIFDVTYRGTHTCQQATAYQIAASASPGGKQEQQQLLLNFRTGLKVKTEDLGKEREEGLMNSSSFSFPHASSSIVECLKGESHFSPPFISPTTSESNFFSMSPCGMNSISYGGGGPPNLHTSESDLNEIISAATSASNSPMLDFSLETLEFDPNFSFDDPTFFS